MCLDDVCKCDKPDHRWQWRGFIGLFIFIFISFYSQFGRLNNKKKQVLITRHDRMKSVKLKLSHIQQIHTHEAREMWFFTRGGGGGGEKNNKSYNEKVKSTHKSVLVLNVVGELELVERDDLGHPLLAGGGRVRMNVHALLHLGVGLARHYPARVVKLVATVVGRHDVHEQYVLGPLLQAAHSHFKCRKHAPFIITNRSEINY